MWWIRMAGPGKVIHTVGRSRQKQAESLGEDSQSAGLFRSRESGSLEVRPQAYPQFVYNVVQQNDCHSAGSKRVAHWQHLWGRDLLAHDKRTL